MRHQIAGKQSKPLDEYLQDRKIFQDWQRDSSSLFDNRPVITTVIKILPMVMEKELSEMQQYVVSEVYLKGRTVTEVAREMGVNKSTISRCATRGLSNLYRIMKYVLLACNRLQGVLEEDECE